MQPGKAKRGAALAAAAIDGATAPAAHWTRWLPGIRMVRDYRAGWLRYDLIAGIVLSTMLVPVGIAYSVASGLPAINGL